MTDASSSAVSVERDGGFVEPSTDLLNDWSYKHAEAKHLARAASECPFSTGRARSLQAASVTSKNSKNGQASNLVANATIIVVAVLFAIFCLLSIPAAALYCILSGSVIFSTFGLRNVHSEGMFFIVERRPFHVGDLIELDPCEASVSLDEFYTWRVESFDLYRTELVALGNHVRNSVSNESLAKRRITNWSRLPVSFQILLKVPVNECDAILFLKSFHEKMEQYANDNPSEWFALDVSIDDAITVGKKYTQYCIEIRHRESWQHYELVLRSKSKLIGYCIEQGQNLSLKKPTRRYASALPNAVGDNQKGCGDDIADIKDNDNDDNSSKNDDKPKIDFTEEKKEEREEGGGGKREDDGAESGNDDDRRIDYEMVVG